MAARDKRDERIAALERALAAMEERVHALEESGAAARPGIPAISPVDIGLAETLRKRAGGPYEREDTRGAVVYGGAVELGEREYLWEMERPAPGLLDQPVERVATVLGVLASPQRLALLKTLLEGPKSSQELQEALGISSPGQLYHHLKGLLSIGIVEQTRRSSYQLAVRQVVPFLAILAAAEDLSS